MIKAAYSKKVRKEDNLCVLIRRDLNSCILFKGHTFFSEQKDIIKKIGNKKKHLIDFFIHYRRYKTKTNLFIGIEAKAESPKIRHFEQAQRYLKDGLNGVFLAYPEIHIPSALKILKDENEFKNIGLITISPFECYILKTARLIKRHSLKKSVTEGYEFDGMTFGGEDDNFYFKELKGSQKKKLSVIKTHIKTCKPVKKLLSIFIANAELRGIDSSLPNYLPTIIKDNNYSINKVYHEKFKRHTRDEHYYQLSQMGIIELDSGYGPFTYSLRSWAQKEDIYKELNSIYSKKELKELIDKLRKYFTYWQETEIRDSFND